MNLLHLLGLTRKDEEKAIERAQATHDAADEALAKARAALSRNPAVIELRRLEAPRPRRAHR